MDPLNAFIVLLVIVLVLLFGAYLYFANVTQVVGTIQYAPNPDYCVTRDPTGKVILSKSNGAPEQTWVYDNTSGQIMYGPDKTQCISGPPDGSEGQAMCVPCGSSPAQSWAYDSTSQTFLTANKNALNLNRGAVQDGNAILSYPYSGGPGPNETWIWKQQG